MRVLGEVAIVIGAALVLIGAFFNALREPDDRFDDYSADMRRTSRRAGPALWRAGLGLAVVGVVVVAFA